MKTLELQVLKSVARSRATSCAVAEWKAIQLTSRERGELGPFFVLSTGLRLGWVPGAFPIGIVRHYFTHALLLAALVTTITGVAFVHGRRIVGAIRMDAHRAMLTTALCLRGDLVKAFAVALPAKDAEQTYWVELRHRK